MTKKNHSFLIFILLMPGIGFIAVMLAASFVMVILQSLGLFNFTGESVFGVHNWIASFTRQNLDSFLYTSKIAFLSSFVSLIIAYPLALQLRRSFFGKKYLNLNYSHAFVCASIGCSIFDTECFLLSGSCQ